MVLLFGREAELETMLHYFPHGPEVATSVDASMTPYRMALVPHQGFHFRQDRVMSSSGDGEADFYGRSFANIPANPGWGVSIDLLARDRSIDGHRESGWYWRPLRDVSVLMTGGGFEQWCSCSPSTGQRLSLLGVCA